MNGQLNMQITLDIGYLSRLAVSLSLKSVCALFICAVIHLLHYPRDSKSMPVPYLTTINPHKATVLFTVHRQTCVDPDQAPLLVATMFSHRFFYLKFD